MARPRTSSARTLIVIGGGGEGCDSGGGGGGGGNVLLIYLGRKTGRGRISLPVIDGLHIHYHRIARGSPANILGTACHTIPASHPATIRGRRSVVPGRIHRYTANRLAA